MKITLLHTLTNTLNAKGQNIDTSNYFLDRCKTVTKKTVYYTKQI